MSATIDEELDEELDELDANDDVPGIVAPRAAPPPAAAAESEEEMPVRKAAHLVQQVGDRSVEIYAYLDGTRILLDSVETHGAPGTARHAFESLLQRLGAEGFLPR